MTSMTRGRRGPMLPRTVKLRRAVTLRGTRSAQPRRDLQIQRGRADQRAVGQARDGAQRARVLRLHLRRPGAVGARRRAADRDEAAAGGDLQGDRRVGERGAGRSSRGRTAARAAGSPACCRRRRGRGRGRGGGGNAYCGASARPARGSRAAGRTARRPGRPSCRRRGGRRCARRSTARAVGKAVGRPTRRRHRDLPATGTPCSESFHASSSAVACTPAAVCGACENVPRFATPVETPL